MGVMDYFNVWYCCFFFKIYFGKMFRKKSTALNQSNSTSQAIAASKGTFFFYSVMLNYGHYGPKMNDSDRTACISPACQNDLSTLTSNDTW